MNISATKTDGQQVVVDGAPAYRVFVRMVVTFPNGFRPECMPQRCAPIPGLTYSATSKTVVYDGSGDFTKTEAGWRAVGGTFNWNKPISDTNEEILLTEEQKQDPNCSHNVGTQAQIDKLASTKKFEPVKNRIQLLSDGSIKWNSTTVDVETAGQFIEQSGAMRPPAYLIYERQPGSSAQADASLREVLRVHSQCFIKDGS
jgi:hypothetical protein